MLVYVWALEQNLEKIRKDHLREVNFEGIKKEHVGEEKFCPNKTNTSGCENENENESRDEGSSTRTVKVNKKREVFEQQDLFVPWKFRGSNQGNSEQQQDGKSVSDIRVFHRFYHVFKKGELLELCSHLEGVTVQDTYYDRGNWCVVLRKDS